MPHRKANALQIIKLWLVLLPLIATNTFANPFVPPEVAAAQYSPRDVAADLGGMPVIIPKHFANYVEYDGEPTVWDGKRKEPKPKRTPQSKISSFGFDVRYPDMVGASTLTLMREKMHVNIYRSMWLSVGITTGEIYPGDGFLDRLTHGHVETPNTIAKDANYEKLPITEYGLTVYAPKGVDPKTNKPYREGEFARDVFVHRNAAGLVDTYIECRNRVPGVASCKQFLGLGTSAKAVVTIIYRRDLLPEWQKIQSSVTQLILSFKAPATTSQTVPQQ